MKYLTIFVMSITILLFAACSSGGGEPTVAPEATETKSALATAVPTQVPAATDESYPANAPTPESQGAYPGAATIVPYDPYPDQNSETPSGIVSDTAYPSEVDLSAITPEPGTGQPQEAPKPGVPDQSAATAHLISQDLATRLDIDISEITVVSTEAKEWGDSSIGCPAPGYAYAQVITPGYQITVETDGEQYTYHTDQNGNFVLCGENGEPVE